MKKIGILTFHDTANFGSALQAYALCKALRNFGADAELIDYQCDAITKRELGSNAGNVLKKALRYIAFGYHLRKKHGELLRFLLEPAMISDKRYDMGNITEANDAYTCFVAGSDIIWGVDITQNDMTYFLDFVNDARERYAFASSIGDRWPEEMNAPIGSALKKFKKIFVRENNAADIVKEMTGKDAELVCDPTMLLEPAEWGSLASEKYQKSDYVLVYFGNDVLLEKARKYASEKKKQVWVINYGIPLKGVKNIRPTSVEEFLGLILYADCIFTGSYHGMLFSLYFHKNFLLNNRAHSSRMQTVLDVLGLQDRLVGHTDNAAMPDYSKIDSKLEAFRSRSLERLKEVLE